MPTIYRRARATKTDGKWQDDPAGSWRYLAIVEGRGKKTGDLRPPFYLRVMAHGKQNWHRLHAETFSDAQEEAEQVGHMRAAAARGLTVKEAEDIANLNRVPVKVAVDTYLEQKASKAHKTKLQYKRTLYEFLEALKTSRVKFLDEVNEGVLRKYKAFMEQHGYAGKTIDTRLNITYLLLKKNGIVARIPRDEMPTVEEEPAVPYTDEELERLFGAMDEEQKIRYKFFLGTGCRDREVTFASWNDLDFSKKEFHVRRKDDVGFTPKSHESRTIPLPESLATALKARRKKFPNSRWVFHSASGKPGNEKPDNHFLRKLKKIALRAGLNCGQCRTRLTVGEYNGKKKVDVTCATHPVCEHYFLHRFRKTCATRWQEHGIPLRTIQAWLGHKNLETTQRYLGVTDSNKLRGQIDKAFGD